ncbi:MAG: hypothetical protein ABIN61_07860 [candidate division WOR-3 bacterium]
MSILLGVSLSTCFKIRLRGFKEKRWKEGFRTALERNGFVQGKI